MIKNYLKIAWRSLWRSKAYGAINILGLASGIAFTLLVAGFVWNELQVNKDLKNADNQYILQSKWKDPNMGFELATLGPLARQLKEQYPNLVANYYRADGITSNVTKNDKIFREGLQVGDSTLLDMYGFILLHGDARTALKDPFTVVITEEKAIKYFGKTDVVGQSLTIENFSGNKQDFTITGVMQKLPRNSVTHLFEDYKSQFFIPVNSLNFFGRDMEIWPNQYIVGYLELQQGIQPSDLDKPIAQLIKQNADPVITENLRPYLVQLRKYYTDAHNGLVKKMLFTLSCIALFILVMAIINFINISISQSASRMREVGIRKVVGGLRRQLIIQFIFESTLLALIGTAFALSIYLAAKPFFSKALGKEIPELGAFPSYFILIPFAAAIIIGFLAGIYPAFILSSLKAVDSLKGKLKSVKENVLLRKSLVGFQFCTAAIAFAGAMIISQQVNLFFSKGLGYNKESIVSAQVPRDWSRKGVEKMETVRNEFAKMPGISQVTLSYQVPDGSNGASFPVYKAGSDSTQALAAVALLGDEHYAATYQIPVSAGSFFHEKGGVYDSSKIVLNEQCVKALGWRFSDDAIGKQVWVNIFGTKRLFTIQGVTRDFHFGSMQEKIQPSIFLHPRVWTSYRFLSFKIQPANIGNTILSLQKKWSQLLPGAPFEYIFMDDTLKKLYNTEIQLKKAAYAATVLALFIVLTGVLGLVSLSIQKRTREIGIRKVLGASVSSIISLFINEFLIVVLIGGLIACPIAYLIMQGWLNNYAYRVTLTARPFIISIVGLALITAFLIAIQTLKTGMNNPVKSLRTE